MCTGLLLIYLMYSVYCYLNHQSFALVEESWSGSADQKIKVFCFQKSSITDVCDLNEINIKLIFVNQIQV